MNAPSFRNRSDYLQTLNELCPKEIELVGRSVFACTWRTTLEQPGFAVIRLMKPVTSRELRRVLISLADAFPVRFVAERLGRFDQQVSSKFHRDGAPSASLLLLGYEPTTVRSRFWIADSSAAAVTEGLRLDDYLAMFNPMFPIGEAKLNRFVTELELPHGDSFIVAINNSQLRYDPALGNPAGVLHKAVIEEPDLNACRVINSIGFTPLAPGTAELSNAELVRFLSRDDLD